MLKKMLPLGLLAVAVLAGCTGPISPDKEGIAPSDYPQVTLDSYWLQARLVVQQPQTSAVGSGQLKVTIPVRTRTDYDLRLQYNVQYFKGGLLVDAPASWQDVIIPRKGTGELDPPPSMVPADDFRVLIRRAK